jgi:hypothetical protein
MRFNTGHNEDYEQVVFQIWKCHPTLRKRLHQLGQVIHDAKSQPIATKVQKREAKEPEGQEDAEGMSWATCS